MLLSLCSKEGLALGTRRLCEPEWFCCRPLIPGALSRVPEVASPIPLTLETKLLCVWDSW